MSRPRPRLVLLASAGVLGLAGAIVLATTSHHETNKGLGIAPPFIAAASFMATGLFAQWRRPQNHFGLLMFAAGATLTLGALKESNAPLAFSAGLLLNNLFIAVFVHMLVAFPRGRLEGRAERRPVGIFYAALLVTSLATVLLRRQCGCASPEPPWTTSQALPTRLAVTPKLRVNNEMGKCPVARLTISGWPGTGRALGIGPRTCPRLTAIELVAKSPGLGATAPSGVSDCPARPTTTRPTTGRQRHLREPAQSFIYFLWTLSFTSSTASSALSSRSWSASCALSIVESSLPLSLPLSSWRSPSRLVSSSPVMAPTACFARPVILSVFALMTGASWGSSGVTAKIGQKGASASR